MRMKITIYSTPSCHYCSEAKAFLDSKGIPYTVKDVSTDEKAAEELVQKSGQSGVPVIEIDSRVIVGYSEANLKRLLKLP